MKPELSRSTRLSPTSSSLQWWWTRALLVWCGWGLLSIHAGCVTLSLENARRAAQIVSWPDSKSIGTRAVKRTNKLGPIKRLFAKPPSPSKRTQQVLRQNVLDVKYAQTPDAAIQQLQALAVERPTLEKVHAVAELAYQQGDWARRLGQHDRALLMYSTALLNSHQFLFDANLDITRNAYDPQFRSISDIYNHSLEAVLRILAKRDRLAPGQTLALQSLDRMLEFTIVIPGRWKNQAIERFEFANDFEPQGIENQYQTFGLGVPLIGVRQQAAEPSSLEQHYPPGLTMAFTAFLDLDGSVLGSEQGTPGASTAAKLILFDPLEQNVVQVGHRLIPLESDITTPMAYYLDDPLLHTSVFATFALLDANFAKQFQGIYMLEPYDPRKTPVVMVHGLWSSPVTWLQMFNDLRADRDIRDHYQFWFCLYPTGQPFWESARQVRQDLANLRQQLAAEHPDHPPESMILVGHSMGGLVSRMLTIHSRDRLWNTISDHPLEGFEGDPLVLSRLRSTFYFDPCPGIRRVVTIGTPHRGSNFATDATQWLGEKFIRLPQMVANDYANVAKLNREKLKNDKPLIVATSLDSLSPKNPLFGPLLTAEAAAGVRYHNIYGDLGNMSWLQRLSGTPPGDGIVSVESAAIPYADSELAVDAPHTTIHQHPATINELRRILWQDLQERNPAARISAGNGEAFSPLSPRPSLR